MAEEKSYSEICKDLLTLVKTFQKAYIETKKDLQNLSAQRKEEEQEELQQTKGTENEKEKINVQEENEQMEQGKKAENQQAYISEGKLNIQQIDSGTVLMKNLIKKKGARKRKASAVRLRKRDWIWELWNQRNKERKSRRPREKIIGLGKGERRRRERGKEGSYKTRRKKRKERVKLTDWNFKENG